MRDWRAEKGRGREAETPSQVPAKGWKDIAWRLKDRILDANLGLVAAGATFYILLSLFPAVGAMVSVYGLLNDANSIADQLALIVGLVPEGGLAIVRDIIRRLAGQQDSSLSIGFVAGLLFSLWSANAGIKSLFQAMNVAYEETEKRSFVRLNLITLGFTLGALVLVVLFLLAVGVVPLVLALFPLGWVVEWLVAILRWPILAAVAYVGILLLYRYGPSREKAKWRWLTWGGVFATVLWLLASILFSWYLANFAHYDAVYGSLGAAIGFMMWTWISVQIVIVGAELNAELEHQTARDTTTAPDRPLGERGAVMADTVGISSGSVSRH
jgi:membrane protein